MTRWPKRSVEERFWSHVDKRSDRECWEWRGSKQPNGYGGFRVTAKRLVRAHRFAYQQAVGPVSRGMVVMHTCDNPPCCNPAHLRLGTQRDNIRDCMSKGRFHGKRPAVRAKLTPVAVREILTAARGYGTGQVLAKKFGVTSAAISAVRKRKNWKHVD